MDSRSRGVLDIPLEPVIGLAEGETMWGYDGFIRHARPRPLNHGLVVRDARRCRAPHHEGLRPHPRDERNCVHPWERALARVSKDEAT
jgi:hypothetical protein